MFPWLWTCWILVFIFLMCDFRFYLLQVHCIFDSSRLVGSFSTIFNFVDNKTVMENKNICYILTLIEKQNFCYLCHIKVKIKAMLSSPRWKEWSPFFQLKLIMYVIIVKCFRVKDITKFKHNHEINYHGRSLKEMRNWQ